MPSERTQFKKIAFLMPRSGMGLAEFHAYWRGTHGPTVAGAPDYAAYRSRYAQNHRIGDGPVGASFPYPGVAIFHLPGAGSNEAAFSASATYRDHVRVDELNFIDVDRTVSMAATEHVLRVGTGPAKLLVVGAGRDGLDRAEFDRRLLECCTAARSFAELALGWTLNLVVQGTLTLPGARPAEGFTVDFVQELWFASEDALASAYTVAAYREHLAPAERDLFAPGRLFSFRAREFVFFDQGRLVSPPPG